MSITDNEKCLQSMLSEGVFLEIMSGFILCVVHTYGTIFRIFGDWFLEFYLESDLYIFFVKS